jgi:uncharacterized protein (DUF58 family)
MKQLTPLKLRHAADEAASDLPSLLAAAEKAAESVLGGEHRLRKPGRGDSFWQFRDYQSHDSPQEIDWRQSAKTDRVFIRQKEKQTPQPVALWCAAGPSMNYASNRKLNTKAFEAAVITLALSLLLTKRGEHVSFLGGQRRPGRSEYTLSRLGEQLIDNMNCNAPLPPDDSSGYVPSGHTAILAGDFLQNLADIEDSLRQLAGLAGTGFIIQVLDPAELDMPFDGRIIFKDPADGRRIPVENAADIRKAYRERIDAHNSAIAHLCRELHWKYYLHRTDVPLSKTLAEVWEMINPKVRGFG